MSTRCQVRIEGCEGSDDVITVYHHCDGYPSWMVPLIEKAYRKAIMPIDYETTVGDKTVVHQYEHAGMLNRGGYMASAIVAADPHGYQIENGNGLHGDIEYLYIIRPIGGTEDRPILKYDGTEGTYRPPMWTVEIRTPRSNGFWNRPRVAEMRIVTVATEIGKLAEDVRAIEDRKRLEEPIAC